MRLIYLLQNNGLEGFESWEWHMSPRVRTRHGEVTAELAWSGSGSRSEITPAVERTVHYPPPPPTMV
ncbi:hypothetical protein Hanom_Chr01g00077751 [Helianthus anomalus]